MGGYSAVILTATTDAETGDWLAEACYISLTLKTDGTSSAFLVSGESSGLRMDLSEEWSFDPHLPGVRPDPEVVAKPRRRQFTAEYKLRILEETDRCSRPGEIGLGSVLFACFGIALSPQAPMGP